MPKPSCSCECVTDMKGQNLASFNDGTYSRLLHSCLLLLRVCVYIAVSVPPPTTQLARMTSLQSVRCGEMSRAC
jgi:hypothetical protein